MHEAPNGPPIPPFAKFMVEHGHLFFVAFLIISALTLASSIGLLKRMNWARLIFIAIMILGIVWNLGGMLIPFLLFPAVPPVPDHAPPGFGDQFEIMTKVMTGFGVVIALAFSALFGWIIKRLVSPEIRREFSKV